MFPAGAGNWTRVLNYTKGVVTPYYRTRLCYRYKTRYHINSFFPRGIRLWNDLPTKITLAPTEPAFASGLNKFYAF